MIDVFALGAIICGTIILTYCITHYYVMPIHTRERERMRAEIREDEILRCAKVLNSWYNPMVPVSEWMQRLRSEYR